ncbi:MAG: flagellar hook assembly protein FlgD [Azonexus sp.]|nr:flagellar hook assembly protein FlgD [Betaproteobacteria bacterium]MBK8918709.1 flagellar hook assembly protein FlgD [Betaproteobacteria bacterium]MBP6034642.1 flagellar hook assembly protein FlgD [Azonexus sp.]MBP6905182.1 flagellar hook assembly protein FlgD [Azonexus sp.]
MATTSSTSAAASAADLFASLNGTSSTTKSKSTTEAMEDRFLTLLMTQIKNQDPLNPLDNAQVTTQLAQINTVNGIERLNATLTKLLDGYNNAQAMQAAGIIGKTVLVPGKNINLSEGVAAAGFKLDQAVDNVQVQVFDKSGNLVRTANLGEYEAGTATFLWDGKNNAGGAVPDGSYSFKVTATQDSKTLTPTALQLGLVGAVTRSGNGFVLDLGSLGDFAFNDVQEIY